MNLDTTFPKKPVCSGRQSEMRCCRTGSQTWGSFPFSSTWTGSTISSFPLIRYPLVHYTTLVLFQKLNGKELFLSLGSSRSRASSLSVTILKVASLSLPHASFLHQHLPI